MAESELGKLEEILQQAPAASLDDLLGKTQEKAVYLKTLKKTVKIRPIKAGDLADVSKMSKGDNMELAIGMVSRGLVEPKIDWIQARKLDPMVLLEITGLISEYSGLTEEATEEAKNLLGVKGTPSG